MSFTDNFSNPKGLLGRLMLVSMDKEHLPMAQWALEQIKIPDSGKVADIGCGGGYNIRRMLEMSPKAKYIGLDISDESVKKAEKVNKAELGKRVKIVKGNAERLPFKDKSIDLITAFETVFFWENPENGFKEVYRTLVKDGCFAVINNYGDPNVDWEKKVPCMTRYTAEQIIDMMKSVGFGDISVNKKENLFLVMGYKRYLTERVKCIMYQTTVKIDGMMCGMCESHVNDAIRAKLSVKKVRSSHKKGEKVIISENELTKQMLTTALNGSGYTVMNVTCEPYEKKGLFGRK